MRSEEGPPQLRDRLVSRHRSGQDHNIYSSGQQSELWGVVMVPEGLQGLSECENQDPPV